MVATRRPVGALVANEPAGRTSTAPRALATLAADLRHVSAIFADGLATLTTGLARFFGSKLVCRALLVGRPATLAGDLAATLARQRPESVS